MWSASWEHAPLPPIRSATSTASGSAGMARLRPNKRYASACVHLCMCGCLQTRHGAHGCHLQLHAVCVPRAQRPRAPAATCCVCVPRAQRPRAPAATCCVFVPCCVGVPHAVHVCHVHGVKRVLQPLTAESPACRRSRQRAAWTITVRHLPSDTRACGSSAHNTCSGGAHMHTHALGALPVPLRRMEPRKGLPPQMGAAVVMGAAVSLLTRMRPPSQTGSGGGLSLGLWWQCEQQWQWRQHERRW